VYGALDLATDRRDFAHEALEEAADGLVYVASALMRADADNAFHNITRCRRWRMTASARS